MKKILKVVLILALVLVISGCAVESSPGNEIGDRAPDFQLLSLEGKAVSLDGFRGKPVFINFWSVN